MSKRLEILVVTGDKSGTRVAIPDGGLRVGRSSSNDLAIRDEELSRSHCLFEPAEGDAIRVIDLASANGTSVNGNVIGSNAQTLKAGDQIEIGTTTIKVVGEEDGAAQPQKPAADQTPFAVDLGLGPAVPAAPASGSATPAPMDARRKFANILWGVVVAVLSIAIYLLLTGEGGRSVDTPSGDSAGKGSSADSVKVPVEQPTFTYERVEATATKIVRYFVELSADGMVSLRYDAKSAIGSDDQKVDERGVFSEVSLRRINEIFDSADWLGFESSFGPSAATSNTLKSWRIKRISSGRVKEVAVENTTLSAAFQTVCENIEALVNNDLGVSLVVRPPEECLAASRRYEELADELADKSEVKEDNLWQAIKNYRKAQNELKGMSAFFEEQNRIAAKISAANAALQTRYREIQDRADRAKQIEDWQGALIAYREIRALIPDISDPRGAGAVANLRDIEARLEAARKGKKK